MGNNQLNARSDGQTVQSDDVNQYRTALMGHLVPRNNTSASPEASAGNLGTSDLPWSNLYLSGGIYVDGVLVELGGGGGGTTSAEKYQVVSGKSKASGAPSYLEHVPGTSTAQITATSPAPNAVFLVNGTTVTLTANKTISSLSLAPGSSNQCLINNSALAAQVETKFIGDLGEALAIDTVGTEITNRNGTIQAFKKGSEYFLALIDTTNNQLKVMARGYAGTARETLSDNDALTLLAINHIWLDKNGTDVYKSTVWPSYGSTDPSSPVSNQWYFDQDTSYWRVYDGSWTNKEAIYLGHIICDSLESKASVNTDFTWEWKGQLEGGLERMDNDTVRVTIKTLGILGKVIRPVQHYNDIKLSVSGDRESGVSEAASTTYWIYVDQYGKPFFSNVMPRVLDERQGAYHPHDYWRCIGTATNDASSNIEAVKWWGDALYPLKDINNNLKRLEMGGPAPVWASTSAITLPAGLYARSDDDTLDMVVGAAITLSLGSTGVNGLDTGTVAAGWYYVWLISDHTGMLVRAIASLSTTAPTMPAGYSKKRRLPIALLYESGALRKFRVQGGWPYTTEQWYQFGQHGPYTQSTEGDTKILDNANSNGSYTTANLGAYVPAISRLSILNGSLIYRGGGSDVTDRIKLREKDASFISFEAAAHSNNSSYQATNFIAYVPTNASQQIEYRNQTNDGTIDLSVAGYLVTDFI